MFEELQVKKELENAFLNVEVVKIVTSRSSGDTVIHLKSKQLLENSVVMMMQKEMFKQFFGKLGKTVRFSLEYDLSKQYTVESLWNLHKDNLIEEVIQESRMSGLLLKYSPITFDCEASPNRMVVQLEDSFINRNIAEQLKVYLEHVFYERFQFLVSVEFVYHEVMEQEKISKPEVYTVEFVKKETPKEENRIDTKKGTPTRNTVAVGKEKSEFPKTYKKKLPDDPDIFYGRPFDGEVTPLKEVQDEIGEVVVYGKVLSNEEIAMRNGEKLIVKFNFTDLTDTISGKLFLKLEEWAEIKGNLKAGQCIKLKGLALYDRFDREITINSIVGIKKISNFIQKRMDTYAKKRVELHAHTTMSDMDAVVDAKTLIKTAFEWGHPGIAITDHGVVQAFPEANHALNPKDYKDDEEKMQRAKDFKILYGMEAYLVDDVEEIVKYDKGQALDTAFVVFDIETTGFDKVKDKIIEIGAVKVINGEITERFSSFINPKIPIPAKIEELTHISDEMVMDAPEIDVVLPQFLTFCHDCVLVAHNASFDTGFIRSNAQKLGKVFDFTIVDTVGLA